jgi:hypothetical protein
MAAHRTVLARGVAAAVLVALAAIALALPARADAAPLRTISRYVSTTDTSRWYDLGCALGHAVANGTRPRDAEVVLAFGDPSYNGTYYGAWIYNNSFRSTPQIRAVAEQYGYGYYVCSPSGTSLEIVMGTTNHGSHVGYNHGVAWANMVDATNAYFRNNCCISSQVNAVGGNDIELGWNPPSVTFPWIRGYDSANSWSMINFGDAAGCPPYGSCSGGWTIDDVWWASWGASPDWPLPQIYNETGANAREWYRISLHGYTAHSGASMYFIGSMAQWQACTDRGYACTGTKNTAAEAWTQLHDALNADSRTSQTLVHSTDISWND